jgi:hypothetical protein
MTPNLFAEFPRTASVNLIVLLLTLGSLGLVGCIGPGAENLMGSDNGAFFPAFRTTLNRDHPQAHTIEMDFAYGAGTSSQQIDSGDYLNFKDVRFNGPAQISSDYKLYAGSVSFLGGISGEVASLDLTAGVGLVYLDLEVKSGAIAEHGDTFFVGPFLGTQLSVRPASWFTLYVRGSLTTVLLRGLSSMELGVSVTPMPRVAIFGGWRRVHYVEQLSDGDLKLTGPMAGIHLMF